MGEKGRRSEHANEAVRKFFVDKHDEIIELILDRCTEISGLFEEYLFGHRLTDEEFEEKKMIQMWMDLGKGKP